MKHYTETIPVTLAEKLKENGMPNIDIIWNPIRKSNYCGNTYAEVFDWFAEQGYYISIHSAETPLGVGFYPAFNHKNFRSVNALTWHEAANAAIEKALTLI